MSKKISYFNGENDLLFNKITKKKSRNYLKMVHKIEFLRIFKETSGIIVVKMQKVKNAI